MTEQAHDLGQVPSPDRAIAQAYLADVAARTEDLPGPLRDELLDDLSAHITSSYVERDPALPAPLIRQILDDLGSPAEIADSARRVARPEASPSPYERMPDERHVLDPERTADAPDEGRATDTHLAANTQLAQLAPDAPDQWYATKAADDGPGPDTQHEWQTPKATGSVPPDSVASRLDQPAGDAPTRRTTPGGSGATYDGLALLALTVGFFAVPLVGWLAGLVMVWLGPRWGRVERLLATALWPVIVAVPLALATLVPDPVGGPVAIIALIGLLLGWLPYVLIRLLRTSALTGLNLRLPTARNQ